MRSAEWYFDEDTIGVAKVLAAAKLPVTWPGDDGKRAAARLSQEPSPIATSGRPDEEWIPAVAHAGLPIVTRDRKILARTSEVNAVIASRARMFAITSLDGITLSSIRRLYPGSE